MRSIRFIYLGLFTIISFLAFNNCSPHSGVSSPLNSSLTQRGDRILAMDTNDSASDFSFTQSFAAAQSVGVSAGTFHVNWSTDEGVGSGNTSGAFTDTFSALQSISGFYANTSPPSKVSLTVAPIDTAGAAFPSDLNGLSIDNPIVILRFNKFMDWVILQTQNANLTSVQIGNEFDVTAAAASPKFWIQYKSFLTSIVAHLHAIRPGLKVGFTVTLYGLIGEGNHASVATDGVLALLPVVDEIGLTYYPLDSSFLAKDPGIVASDFSKVFDLVKSTPVYFQEVGYPTSGVCGGSETNQAKFIEQIFAAWDAHAGQIPFLSLLRMNDYSEAKALSTATAYGLGSNAAFISYLQSLGLRSYPSPSANKPAWSELQNQTALRGWR